MRFENLVSTNEFLQKAIKKGINHTGLDIINNLICRYLYNCSIVN